MSPTIERIQALGDQWHAHGSVTDDVVAALGRHVSSMDCLDYTIETGVGRTSLLLSQASKHHVVFTIDDPDSGSLQRTQQSPLLNEDTVEWVVGPTPPRPPERLHDTLAQVMTVQAPPSAEKPQGQSRSTDVVAAARKGRFRKLNKLAVLARRRRWRSALRHGVAAAVEHRRVPFGSNFATVIDVGAHHGQFALVARELFPAALIYCVEPLPSARDRLDRVMSGDDRTSIIAAAAAAASGERSMHVSRKTDSSSLLAIRQPCVDAFPGTEEASIIEVAVGRLDELVPTPPDRPCLLKIDAQGGELDVLEGATSLLEHVDAAYIECSFVEFYDGQALADEVIGALLGHGLRLAGIYSVVQDHNGKTLQADFLFQRQVMVS